MLFFLTKLDCYKGRELWPKTSYYNLKVLFLGSAIQHDQELWHPSAYQKPILENACAVFFQMSSPFITHGIMLLVP